MKNPPILRATPHWPVIVTVVVAAVAGLLCVVLPPYLVSGGIGRTYEAPLFPILRTAIENLQLKHTMIGLFVLGVVLGFLQPRSWCLVGAGTVLLLPLAAMLEMIADGTSHNLFPLEFGIYAFIGLPAVAGAYAGRFMKDTFTKKRKPDEAPANSHGST